MTYVMAGKSPPSAKTGSQHSREQRLRAALRANLGRRKAQARARTLAKPVGEPETTGEKADNDEG